MKKSLKTLALILSILLCLSVVFASCDKNDGEPQSTTASTTENNKSNNVVNGDSNNGDNDNDNNNGYSELSEEEKYNKACLLITEGKNEEAYKLLNEIKTYAPAKEKLKNFFYAPTVIQEGSVIYGTPEMKYEKMNISYDIYGNIKSITLPKFNKIFDYIYDSQGNELAGYDLDMPNRSSAYHTNSYNSGKLSKVYRGSGTITEYMYNTDDTLKKVITTNFSANGEIYDVFETEYVYTYYDDASIKTMRVAEKDDYIDRDCFGYEYNYDFNGNLEKVNVCDPKFIECYGYLDLEYNDFGPTKIEIASADNSETEIMNEYTYDSNGRLIELKYYILGELYSIYLFSEHRLLYSENTVVKDRVFILTKTNLEVVIPSFVDT